MKWSEGESPVTDWSILWCQVISPGNKSSTIWTSGTEFIADLFILFLPSFHPFLSLIPITSFRRILLSFPFIPGSTHGWYIECFFWRVCPYWESFFSFQSLDCLINRVSSELMSVSLSISLCLPLGFLDLKRAEPDSFHRLNWVSVFSFLLVSHSV